MEKTVHTILEETKAYGRIHTHGSMGSLKSTYNMSHKDRDEFFEMYCDSIEKNDRSVIELGIGEYGSILPHIPVLVDIDIKVNYGEVELNEDGKLYTEEEIEKLITIYQTTINKIIEINDLNDLICVLLEKEPYIETKIDGKKILKNGFHLHFPYIFLDKTDQKNFLLPIIKEELKNKDVFINLVNDSSTLLDDGYLNQTWLLYGSSKGEGKQSYRVTCIYDSNCEKITFNEAFSKYQIYDHKEKLIKVKDPKKLLPRILSIIPHCREIKSVKNNIISPIKQKFNEERKKQIITMEISKQIELCKKIVPLINEDRAIDHNEWMTIGWALYNSTDGSDEGLEIWIEFSAKGERSEKRCEYEWNLMQRNDGYSYTLGTLNYFAKIDNPESYKKIKDENTKNYIENSIDGSNTDIANVLYSEYSDMFTCASISNKIWYKFNGIIWEHIEEGKDLRLKISNELPQRYLELLRKFREEMIEAEQKGSKGEVAMWERKAKSCSILIKNLSTTSFKNNVMREAMDIFHNEKFKHRLDVNPYLIAFKNGIFDLRQNVFRKGRPEDYLSKTLGVRYIEFDEEDQIVIEVKEFLQRIFPDKSLYKYFLDIASDVFVGGNHQKKVYFWLGDGDNGKSMLQILMEVAMGQLAIKFDTTLFTGKRPTQGQAHPELARAGGGVRWAVLEEPDKTETINTGFMKKMSGNDSIFVRDLFEKGKDCKEITPLFKLHFICNHLPNLKNNGKAEFNRIRVLPFESTFVDPNGEIEIPDTLEERFRKKIFPKDNDTENKCRNKWPEPFMWLLMNHRIKNLNSIREEPEKVLEATNSYKRQSDLYRIFIEENIIEVPEKYISITDIYNVFKFWFKESYPGSQLPSKIDVQEYFERIWGLPKNNKWKGYKLNESNDENDEKTLPFM